MVCGDLKVIPPQRACRAPSTPFSGVRANMAYYFVQQYWVLPNIAEALDDPRYSGLPSSTQSVDSSALGGTAFSNRGTGTGKDIPIAAALTGCRSNPRVLGASSFQSSFVHPYSYNQQVPLSTFQMGEPQNPHSFGQSRASPGVYADSGDGAFAMTSLGTSLPSYRASSPYYGIPQNVHRYPSPQAPGHQQQQGMPFGGQHALPASGLQLDLASQYGASPYIQGQVSSPRSQSFQQFTTNRRPMNQSPQSALFPAQQMYYPAGYGQISPLQPNFQGWSQLLRG